MNKKLFTLLALASFSNIKVVAESGCAPEVPWAAQNNVMLVGASLGVASMKDPISARTNAIVNTVDNIKLVNRANEPANNLKVPLGYQSNISELKASAAKMSFAGRLDVQYGMRQGMFGAFLYAGLGLNQSKTTSNSDSVDAPYMRENFSAGAGGAWKSDGNFSVVPIDDKWAPTDYANPKVTITSGLNFQAGVRMGVWVNNMFFHGIVGWQCLNLQSKVSNVYKEFEKITTTKVYPTDEVGGVYALTACDPVEKAPKTSSFTKNKWTNALVLGAGIDFAHQKWTYGFYYQAAICQRTNFKYDNFVVGSWKTAIKDSPEDVSALNEYVGVQKYRTSPVTVSIKPVISTFMMTVKYAFHKA